ncbi:hypothetical protein ACJ72_02557 [Emergomyces africanus]|uniref:F-box domain-containing protein n=1 Tax=Emergomyces africanus TaxID=1955775 RepID=A0A1B7P235_9EURO|nr:hypothetical protein ACJ72_02557 [Emergomyces africanus]
MESTHLPSPPTLYKRTSIEYLPAEIKVEILCQLADLQSLREFVKASPDFHSVYQFDRRRILCRLLARTTPLPILVEVASLPALRRVDHDSLKRKEGEERSLGVAKGFLNIYDELRCFSRASDRDGCDTKPNVVTDAGAKENEVAEKRSINGVNFTYSKDIGISAQFDALSLDELLLVVRQHFIVRSISEDFALSCLTLNPFTGKECCGDSILPLSEAESYRIHRALYRLEMLALIYKLWKVRDPSYFITFLQSLPPWEMEEVHCIRNYMYQIYFRGRLERRDSSNCGMVDGQGRAIDHTQSYKVRRRRRGRAGGNGIGIGRAGSDDYDNFDLAVNGRREQYLTLGLEFLWQWFHESDQDGSRRSNKRICETQKDSPEVLYFLTHALNLNIMEFFRPFVNRSESFTSDANLSGPNLGWEWLHQMNSKYLCQLHNCYIRKWGYVFWDQKRLIGMGLRKEMRREYAPFVD